MILILPRDSSPQFVDEIVAEVGRLGWSASVSRGDEQIAIALSGTGDPRALEAAFERRPDIDVVPILTGHEYWRMRSRRRLLAGMTCGLGVLTAVGAGAPVAGFLLPPKGTLGDPGMVLASSDGTIEEHSARHVVVLGKPVLLVRMSGQRYYALSAICTHQSICHLEWNAKRRELLCPCHGGAFDVHGNVVHGPPSIPLASYPVEQIGGGIYIRREV
jgi:Rieske Fe-S protein